MAGFEGLRTNRLLLRPVRADDAVHLVERRNDPDVARYQTWIPPFPLERAESIIAASAALDGPTNEQWWMLTVTDPDDTVVHGDLVVNLTWEGRAAEIGYTLARSAWGHGYAVEAATALVDHLFTEVGVTRVAGNLHPDNAASAMVLERVGMLFEGHTKLSFWVGDDNSDDWLYGMTRADWEAWRDRPRQRPTTVELIEITEGNLPAVLRARTHHSQERFVDPNVVSLAEALIPSVYDGVAVHPWYRAVRADGDLVGFVMLAAPVSGESEAYLWRLLVDRMHQRRGIGSRILDLVEAQCREWGETTLLTSWGQGRGSPEPLYLARGFVRILDLVVAQCREWGERTLLTSWGQGRGSPEPMYLARGFVPTGEIEDGEIVARLTLP